MVMFILSKAERMTSNKSFAQEDRTFELAGRIGTKFNLSPGQALEIAVNIERNEALDEIAGYVATNNDILEDILKTLGKLRVNNN